MYPWIWIQSILRKLWLPGYTVLIHFGGNWTSPGVQPVASKFGFNRASGGALNRVQTHMGVRVFCDPAWCGYSLRPLCMPSRRPFRAPMNCPANPTPSATSGSSAGPETGTTLRSTPAPAGFSSRTGPLCRWLTSNRAPWWEPSRLSPGACGGARRSGNIRLRDRRLAESAPGPRALFAGQAGGIHIRGRRRGVRPAFVPDRSEHPDHRVPARISARSPDRFAFRAGH